MVISDIASVNVNAYIPESELKNLKIGQNAEVTISAVDQTVAGKVTEVGGVADPTSRTFTIKIKVPNPHYKIRPGMIAEVKILSSNPKAALFVPSNALLKGENNQNYVYVADKKSSKAFRRNVSVGEISENKVEIISGLTEGESIVVEGQNGLVNGSLISIKK
ncbi:efflux RND transporter periplasmic adaptor subunit [Riemerella anatipestifer]|uniref:efflux RND transporter periplasmic adaptor subunit n=1 Tax=Riemerella anatipestifer TaxID=34085 RepID=UPI0030C36D66